MAWQAQYVQRVNDETGGPPAPEPLLTVDGEGAPVRWF